MDILFYQFWLGVLCRALDHIETGRLQFLTTECFFFCLYSFPRNSTWYNGRRKVLGHYVFTTRYAPIDKYLGSTLCEVNQTTVVVSTHHRQRVEPVVIRSNRTYPRVRLLSLAWFIMSKVIGCTQSPDLCWRIGIRPSNGWKVGQNAYLAQVPSSPPPPPTQELSLWMNRFWSCHVIISKRI